MNASAEIRAFAGKKVVTPKFAGLLSQFAKVFDFCERRIFPLRLNREPHLPLCGKPWKSSQSRPQVAFPARKKRVSGQALRKKRGAAQGCAARRDSRELIG